MNSPIRILYDEQIFLLQEYGGISRYFTELIKAFEANSNLGVKPLLSSREVRNQYILMETKTLNLQKVGNRFISLISLAFQGMFHRRLKVEVDLVHQTFYLPGFFSRFSKTPKALTLFDMIPERAHGGRRFWNPHFVKRLVLPKADLLLSISNSSTQDMLSEYGLDLDVTTTYLGVGPEFQPNLPSLDWSPNKYFLFVGNRTGYKDCELAIRAFASVAGKLSGVSLLLAGGGPLTRKEKKLISNLAVENSVIQVSVNPIDLPRVYSNALGLVYPSRYEGFGLPLVEAMASGLPILAANTRINTEISGNCASYFQVGNLVGLSELMLQVGLNRNNFQNKVNSGLVKAKGFTWERCAELTAAEYRRTIERLKVKG